jgi:hypothetical protein
MVADEAGGPAGVRAVRWAARALSAVSIAFVLLIFIGEGIGSRGEGPVRLTAVEIAGLAFFPVMVLLGLVLAWRWEGIGAVITLAGLGAFYILQLLSTGGLPGGPWFALLASPSLLFGLSWLLTRPTGAEPDEPAGEPGPP